MELVWNVFVKELNKSAIKTYNIFNHRGFSDAVKNIFKKNLTKEAFAECIKRELMYYFWAKCEWETVITSWPPNINKAEIDKIKFEAEDFNIKHGHYPYCSVVSLNTARKIDVYEQVMVNWEVFIDYLWTKSQEIINSSNLSSKTRAFIQEGKLLQKDKTVSGYNSMAKLRAALESTINDTYVNVHAVYPPEVKRAFPDCYLAAADIFDEGMTFQVFFKVSDCGNIEIKHIERWFMG